MSFERDLAGGPAAGLVAAPERNRVGGGGAGRPWSRRVAGYSAGSIVAAATSEAAFVVTLGLFHAGTTWAVAAGFVGGAIPNYILNRRWAWPDRRGRDRRTEIALYAAVAVSTFLASAVATHWAETAAHQATQDRGWTVVLTALAYLGVSGVFFLLKFVLYERVVFTPARSGGPAGRPPADSTTS